MYREEEREMLPLCADQGVWMTKEVAWSQLELGSLQAGIDLENRTQIMTTFTRDHQEQVDAFLQRRPARYASE